MPQNKLELKQFQYDALFAHDGLKALDDAFLTELHAHDGCLHGELVRYRQGQFEKGKAQSEMLIAVAEFLDGFVARLFNIEAAVTALTAKTIEDDPIFEFKKQFVLRDAKRALKKSMEFENFDELNQWLINEIKENGLGNKEVELATAILAQRWQATDAMKSARLINWCVLAMTTQAGQQWVNGWVSFHFPSKLDYAELFPVTSAGNGSLAKEQLAKAQWRARDGFHLTDGGMSRRQVMDEIHYCVYCHKNDGDFCSKGFPVKRGKPEQGVKINPLSQTLTGCPLEEKISEMHRVKKAGFALGALAIVMIDNPMCAATGHRICNDCMKACIYQKQEPVNIPEVETRILKDVLHLPWGVECYDLFTRWNPLRVDQPVMKPYNGLKVLVMGMGPAGFTLAHHLLMEGFAVVGADGLKIEPLAPSLLEPIYDFSDINEDLADRVMAGFGGVAEYGITVRWDKNFLKLIYITLARRKYFQVVGNIRFGGTLTVEKAWELGFDHVAVAVGAGLPRELHIKNSLAPGMRQANDFLMALQLTGAAKQNSLANLQVRLPAVVIGGGLTGVDAATEVQAYYIAQVEKVAERYGELIKIEKEELVRSKFSSYDLTILDECLVHAQAVKQERDDALEQGREPNFIPLIHQWGGVTIVYRRSRQESPAYRLNHHELFEAMREGVFYCEGLQPTQVELDDYGMVSGLTCRGRYLDEDGNWLPSDEEQTLPARTILVATGAKPNVAYSFEHKDTLARKQFQYLRFAWEEGKLRAVETMGHVKSPEFGAFTSYQNQHHLVSFLGDTHPVFHGSVVNAVASAKRTYPKIVEALQAKMTAGSDDEYQQFAQRIEALLTAKVVDVRQLAEDVLEISVKAPLAAHCFQPGQFFRLQNFDAQAPFVQGTQLQMEGLSLLAYQKPQSKDRLSFLILQRGGSSRLAWRFKVGDPVALMGPTGVRSRIPQDQQTVMIVGGRMAIPYLLSVAPGLKAAGHQVVFVGYFPTRSDVFMREEIEAAADQVIWVMQQGNGFAAVRDGDVSLQGELIASLLAWSSESDAPSVLQQAKTVTVIGANALLKAVSQARTGILKDHFHSDALFFGSVYGPMQCMLKGVCAQCLQWQIDPNTGERTKAVYACSWQHQPMEMIDLGNVDERLAQNRMQETLTNLWLDAIL